MHPHTTFARSLRRAALIAAACAAGLGSPHLEARHLTKDGVAVSATIHGSFSYVEMAWIGHALVSFDGADPLLATFVDRSDPPGPTLNEDGTLVGTETITFVFEDGSTFLVAGRFVGVPGSTPRLYYLHESGRVHGGTGAYAGIAGCVRIRGPFLFPMPPMAEANPPWIAEMHGTVYLPPAS